METILIDDESRKLNMHIKRSAFIVLMPIECLEFYLFTALPIFPLQSAFVGNVFLHFSNSTRLFLQLEHIVPDFCSLNSKHAIISRFHWLLLYQRALDFVLHM